MAFGWSAGDILSAINFIIEIANALDEVDGAAKQFREASVFLRELNTTLKPLQTFTVLDTKPIYKKEIENHVEAIRTPIETFINNDDVKALQKSLGVVKTGHFRTFRDVKSKIKWHFSTSEKALDLQKVVERHMRIIDNLMHQLTLEMLHELQTNLKGDVGKALGERLDTHLPTLQTNLLNELSQRNETVYATWNTQLETLLVSYLGGKRMELSPLPAPSYTTTAERVYNSKVLMENLMTTWSRFGGKRQFASIDKSNEYSYPVQGLLADPEVTTLIEDWWATAGPEILWIHEAPQATQEHPMATNMVALAHAAQVPVVVSFCSWLDSEGKPFNQLDQLIELLYESIRHFCENVPEDFSTPLDLSASRFSALDGTADSIRPALSILEDLISQNSGRHLVIIDGLDILCSSEDPVLADHLIALLNILMSIKHRVITKTLVLTTQHMRLLAELPGLVRKVNASSLYGSGGFFSLEDFERGLQGSMGMEVDQKHA